MQRISEITEQLASSVVMADPGDLPLLAQMHSQFQAIHQHAQELPDQAAPGITSFQQAVGGAEKLLEQIILQEVTDADAALRSVSQTVAQLQQMVQSGFSHGMVATVSEGEKSAASPSAVAAPNLKESDASFNPDDLSLVNEFISEANTHIESAEVEILKLEENPEDSEAINAVFRSFHTIKGVAGFLNLRQIGALAHAAENLLDLARHGKLALTGPVIDLVLESADSMKMLVGAVNEAAKTGQPIASHERLGELLQRLHACASGTTEQAVAPAPAPAAVANAPTGSTPVAAATTTKQPTGNHGNGAASETTVKVATDRLDSLINTVGELVIAQSMVAQDMAAVAGDNPKLARNMSHLGKITRELQDLSMSMRMVPIQGVFQKMARLVRDLGRKFTKELELVMVGAETELDRNIVEAINDPLVHMVRNSVDHGIESPEIREKAGKPRVGRVELKAYHQAGNIVIEISDDGKGLNKAKILKKAIETGIVKEGQELSDQEIFKLIFHAGLSTADKVTDVSGRGVGMDVVRKNIEALRGRIDITSVEGKGSTFTIRLPLTLAVIDGQVVRVGTQRYILPITSIEQSIRPKPEQISTVQSRGEMCMVRDRLLPLLRLYRMFNITPCTEDPTQAIVVIVQDNDRRCCLFVDELLGQQQVVIKSLGDGIGAVKGVSGGAILGDGNISLILDVPGLIDVSAGSGQ